ncbi:MAG: type IV pilus assembly protein PilM [Candidatus Omnitrophica bacterium]|nr:type IV pilus assembly protein PilM [Candidatus Omnitrophota bacterium]
MAAKQQISIGLEIGDGLVKAMEIVASPRQSEVKNYAKVPVNFREGKDGIVKAIKEVMLKINAKKNAAVNIAISGESVIVRDIHWPEMAEADIRKALQFEVERQTNAKAEEIIFDYCATQDKTLAETKTRVLLVAAKKDLIENYTSLVAGSGYACNIVEVDTFSLLNCFLVNGPSVAADRTVAVVNIGMEVTNIDILRGKSVGLTKDAFVAWSNLVDALPPEIELDFNNAAQLKGVFGSDDIYELCLFITNALSNQIRRTIEFYESQGRYSVEEVYLCGRMARYKNLDKYLQNILGLKVTIWNPLGALKCAKQVNEQELAEDALMLAVCTGLASRKTFPINLNTAGGEKKAVKKENVIWQQVVKYKVFVAAYTVLFFFMIAVWVIISNQVAFKKRLIQELTDKNREMLEVVEEVKNLEAMRGTFTGQVAMVRAIFSQRINWSKKLSAVSRSIPREICLTDFAVKEINKPSQQSITKLTDILQHMDMSQAGGAVARMPQLLTLKGIVAAAESDMLSALNEFLNNLKKDEAFSRDFMSVDLVRTYQDEIDKRPVMRFEIACVLQDR